MALTQFYVAPDSDEFTARSTFRPLSRAECVLMAAAPEEKKWPIIYYQS